MSPETLLAEVTFEHTIMSVLKFQTHLVQMIESDKECTSTLQK